MKYLFIIIAAVIIITLTTGEFIILQKIDSFLEKIFLYLYESLLYLTDKIKSILYKETESRLLDSFRGLIYHK